MLGRKKPGDDREEHKRLHKPSAQEMILLVWLLGVPTCLLALAAFARDSGMTARNVLVLTGMGMSGFVYATAHLWANSRPPGKQGGVRLITFMLLAGWWIVFLRLSPTPQ